VPSILAGASLGVVQAAHTHWFVHDGDLAVTMSESLAVLERGISTDPRTWAEANARAPDSLTRRRQKPLRLSDTTD
jgi:hypothetical protein